MRAPLFTVDVHYDPSGFHAHTDPANSGDTLQTCAFESPSGALDAMGQLLDELVDAEAELQWDRRHA